VQPPFDSQTGLFPSFGYKLLLGQLTGDVRSSTLELISRSIEAEEAHALHAIESLIHKTEEALESQISEREDALDAYFQGLHDAEEAPRPQKINEEINALVHLPLRFNNDIQRMLADDPQDARELIQDLVASQLTVVSATRVIGAIQTRVGEQVQWPSPLPAEWDELSDILLDTAREALARKRERLNAQVARDIDVLLQRDGAADEAGRLRLLITLSQGTRTAFDQKTHKQVKQLFSRFTYVYHAAQLLEGRSSEDIIEDAMEHLEHAEQALRGTWGQSEFNRLSQNAAKLADFGPAARIAFGEERLNEPVSGLSESERAALADSIGRYVLNEVHRQLLVGAISELWVEYLTKVEALRVSIGLEAYAQRDPLVQYKGRASEMYAQLLEDVRGLVIGRAFAARPRRVEITPIETTESESVPTVETAVQIGGGRKKRKRH
jgi:preprotein translocase subunit SecA